MVESTSDGIACRAWLLSLASLMTDKIKEYLIQNGQYDQLVEATREKLMQSGWYDQVNAMAAKVASTSDDPSITNVASSVEPQAMSKCNC